MTDLSTRKPMIGVYDEFERTVTIYQLEPEESGLASIELSTHKRKKYEMKEVGGYGTFKPIYKLENFYMKK